MLVAKLSYLFLCLAIGAALRRVPRMPPAAPMALNRFVITVSLPAVTLLAIHQLRDFEGMAVAMAWIIFAAAVVFFAALGRALAWDRATVGCLVLTAGLGNTSFVGYPVIEALFGREALRTAILNDQPGSFLVLSTLGLLVASVCSGRSVSASSVLRRVLGFPPVIALLLAVVTRGVAYPAQLEEVLKLVGATLTPLALIAVGFQLRLDRKVIARRARELALGVGFKLVLAPVLIAVIELGLLHARGQSTAVTIIESAMGPMITGAVVAAEYGLAPELATLMVGVGIPLSAITIGAWIWVVTRLAS